MTNRVSDTESVDVSQDSVDHLEVIGDIDTSVEIADRSSILIVSRDQSYLTHGIHKFPAKFFPELPRYLIRKLSVEGDVVLDPMCGSGTVILEGLLNNRKCIGIDIDPIARLLTKVKTTPLNPSSLQLAAASLVMQIQKLDSSAEYSPNIPQFHYRDNWFRPFVLRELAIINDSIDIVSSSLPTETCQDIQDFFRVIMSSIIRDMSNADPHCTRTVLRKKVVKNISPGDTLSRFKEVLLQQSRNMADFAHVCDGLKFQKVSIPETNALNTGLASETVNLAITSPPYINAVDYPRTHQLEMYWLGFLGDGPLSKLKRTYIGTETVYKNEYENLRTFGIATLDSLIERIYRQDPRRSYIVFKFFSDMQRQLSETLRVLKPGGRYCLAIGNNVIRGLRINSHDILAQIATEYVGFSLERMFFSRLIRHFIKIPRQERMIGEWVLVLRKCE
ncbi:MAG: site-specific DNA-methyltransferase [Candidatus Thorarchaeota archaeon]|nr:site-specific DNA-methyltransferase [Candidatus Thorarchaeota archaeon]